MTQCWSTSSPIPAAPRDILFGARLRPAPCTRSRRGADVETIIPKRQMVQKILDQLGDRVPDFDPQSVLTGIAVLEFASVILSTMESHFARYGLSQGRFTVLMFLFHFPDVTWTPASLASAAGVSRATMTGLVQGLERDEWVVRAPDPDDGRRFVIDLSESGRSRFPGVISDHFGRFGAALAGVGEGEHVAFRDALGAFRDRVTSVTAPTRSDDDEE